MECDSENGSGELLIWKLLEKNFHPFFSGQCYLVHGTILCAPIESPTVYLLVLGQWVSEAGTL